MTKLKRALEGASGYVTGLRLSKQELATVRELIRAQWLRRIREIAPFEAGKFEDTSIDRYHELAPLIDHKRAWPKLARMLPQDAVDEIRNTSLVEALTDEFGAFTISDEENLGRENIYWRLVRPNAPGDIGPVHADQWFWALGHGSMPRGMQRVKVWVALHCEPGQAGFRFVPGSHQKQWPYYGEQRDGFVKPQFDIPESDLDLRLFESEPGQAIVFHDRLLHGGAPGGTLTRVSMEFTMFVKNEHYFESSALT
jgi:hypothetical protein